MRRDPVELEIFKNLFHSIAEEMGAALRRTAFSPNIKERRDYSCAVFDGAGEVIAMGDHMPVHLGSMPMSVRAAIAAREMAPGDVVMLNDPFRGGTHLPDITLVAPVYVRSGRLSAAKSSKPSRLLRSVQSPSCRRRRSLRRIHGALPRDLSGRTSHSPGQNHAGGRDGSRCAGAAAEQRAHARGARRRFGSADRRLPHRSRAPNGGVCAVRHRSHPRRGAGIAGVFRGTDARIPAARAAGHVSRGGFSGQRRHPRQASEDRSDSECWARQGAGPGPQHSQRSQSISPEAIRRSKAA